MSPTPAVVGPNGLLMEVSDSTGAPVEGAVVTVVARLGEDGAVVRDTARSDRDGRYTVRSFPFPTGGEWTLSVRAELADGRRVEVVEPIRVVDTVRTR